MKLQKIFLILVSMTFAACGSSSKKLVSLPPLPVDAPVQMFYSEPNLKFEKVCEIESVGDNSFGGYSQKEDFEKMFKKEARKCGANAVIYRYMMGYSKGSMTGYATGVTIQSQAAGIESEDKIKAFSLAIQTHDLNKVKEVLANVPKDKNQRAPSDDQLINLGLYIATLDGLKCDKKVVDLLEKEYGGIVPKFNAVPIYALGKPESNSPLCLDVMAHALPKMIDQSDSILKVHNYYVGTMNDSYDKDISAKAAKFNLLLKEASRIVSEACVRSSTDSTCVLKHAFLEIAANTKSSKIPSVRKNSQDISKILK